MTYLPQYIWNEIAITQVLKTEWAKKMFTMPDEMIDEEIDRQAVFFCSMGFSNKVVSAFLQLTPLLLEHEAITNYISSKKAFDLRNALPEIQDAGDAVVIAKHDHILKDQETKTLYCLFKAIENSQMIN
jgi:hypothetical protein